MKTLNITRADNSLALVPAIEEFRQLMEQVASRAYQLFEERGREHGKDMDDWLAAEKQILGMPAAELKESHGAYLITVLCPASNQSGISLITSATDLVLKAETSRANGGPSVKAMRSMQYPSPVDVAGVRASFGKGVLRVTAPKSSSPVGAHDD